MPGRPKEIVDGWYRMSEELRIWAITNDRHPLRKKVVKASKQFWDIVYELCLFIDAFNESRSLTGENGVIFRLGVSKQTVFTRLKALELRSHDFQDPHVTVVELIERSPSGRKARKALEAVYHEVLKTVEEEARRAAETAAETTAALGSGRLVAR